MARSFIVGLCCIALVAAMFAVPASRSQAQDDPGLSLITQFLVPGSRFSKFPHVAASDGQVYVTGNIEKSDAAIWSKADGAGAFGDLFVMGPAESDPPDFAPTSVTIGPDGSVVAAWSSQDSNTVYMRLRSPSGEWGPLRRVADTAFPVFVEVAVATNGTIFLAWMDPDQTAKYTFSTNQGVTWASVQSLGDLDAYGTPLDITAGPNGEVGVAWTAGVNNRLQVFVGLWTGAGFAIQRVSEPNGGYANPTITFTPNGKTYVAYRGLDPGGVIYAERKPDGTWPPSTLFTRSVEVINKVNINSDEQGNLHFHWIASPSGGNRIFYLLQESGGRFRGPLQTQSGPLYNPNAAASISTAIYSHSTVEEFSGGVVYMRYSLWRAEGRIFGGDPLIEGGAATVSGKSNVSVSFGNLRGGTPNGIRWNWGAPPTDADNDSGGFKPFANPISVPIPAEILEDTSCRPVTLYTQLRNTEGVVEDPPKSDSILVDGVVEGTAIVGNPFLYAAPPAVEAVQGAPAGDPRFTRVPLLYLQVTSGDDCTGLKTVGVGRSADNLETVLQIGDEGYQGFVALPGLRDLDEGPVPVTVQLGDSAGNTRNSNFTITFDETKPRLSPDSPGTVTAAASPQGDLLQNLTFSNIQVTDAGYGGRGFWGVWIANSRTPVDPDDYDSLSWTAVRAPGTSRSFTLTGWSLASGLPADDVTAGTYYVYVRFLDGAGNPSDGALPPLQVESEAIAPAYYLPLVQK